VIAIQAIQIDRSLGKKYNQWDIDYPAGGVSQLRLGGANLSFSYW